MGLKEKTHVVQVEGMTPHQIWQIWTDINNWHTWDSDIEWAKLTEPFRDGSRFYLKPKGGPRVRIVLMDVKHEESFTDLAKFPFAKMYSIHKLTKIGTTLKVLHTVRVEGLLSSLWWHLVGKNVAAGLEVQSKKMIEKARTIGV